MNSTTPTASPEQLRADMVAALRKQGSITSPAVEAAMAVVPREKFALEADPLAVYSPQDVVVTKRDESGRATSSISAPWLQAEMLEAARLTPGCKVLEIGSGGYNAALIAEIVGPGGLVVTVDIDPFVTERTARFLTETGYGTVQVVLGDAETAAEPYIPEGGFDAILVTVGAWDCPWGHLLAQGGRMIIPLRFATITRSFTFIRDGDAYIGHNPTVCGFVTIQGAGAHADRQASLADDAVRLTLEGGPQLDASALDQALTGERVERWTGVTVAKAEPFDSLHLWIATIDDRFGMIWADPDRSKDLVRLAMRRYCPLLATPHSLAYLTIRDASRIGDKRWEFGVHGHGRDGAQLAEQLHDYVRVWDRRWRSHPGPDFTLYPAHATVPTPKVGRVFVKKHTQLAMVWNAPIR